MRGEAFEERSVELESTDPAPEHRFAGDVSVSVLDPQVTETSPAKLRLTFEYGGDEKRGLELPFFSYRGQPAPSTDPGLLLLDSKEYDRRTGCWKKDSDQGLSGPGVMPGKGFEPGEQLRITSYVWADHRYDGCFEPGTYRFEETLEFEDDEYTWGFTLRVSRE